MTFDVSIRRATPEDAAVVERLSMAAFGRWRSVYRPVGEAAARQAERAREGTRLVARIDDRIVGTVQYAVHAAHVHLLGLAVDPAQQRCGIARRLVESVVARTPDLDRDVVALDTIAETGNVEIFRRMGFAVVDEYEADWCESDDFGVVHEVLMERAARSR